MQKRLKEIFMKFPKIKVVDGVDLVPHKKECFIADVLHPNDLGFKEYSKNLIKKLKTL